MRAVVYDGQRVLLRTDYPVPVALPNEAIVKVHLAGICSTDLEITKGYFGFQGVLGHEFVGTVTSATDAKWIGQRVVSSINFAPPGASQVNIELLEHMPGRSVLGIYNRDGAMADYVAIPERNLFVIPESVSDEEAVFAEPLAAAIRIADQIPIRPSSRLAVIGPGRLGMLIASVLSLSSSQITLIGRSNSSLALAKQLGLITLLSQEAELTNFDCVVDATGNVEGLKQAMRITKPCGTIVLKSTYAGAASIDFTPIVVNELKVQGSRCGPFAPALRLLERKAIPVRSLIDRKYPIGEAAQAFQHAAQSGVRKILIELSTL